MKYEFVRLNFDCNSVEVCVSFQTSFLVRLSWPEFEVGAVQSKENENRQSRNHSLIFFEIEECFFPILFTSTVRVGEENQCENDQR
jgi:hypothetical protein